MKKLEYEAPEMLIRWFESEDICGPSSGYIATMPGDNIVNDDEWGNDGW